MQIRATIEKTAKANGAPAARHIPRHVNGRTLRHPQPATLEGDATIVVSDTNGNGHGAAANQKAATQARILAAAVALFSARGFDRTSIGSIAVRASVSRAAVFWHFGDKQSLFQHVCKEMLLPFIEQLQQSLQHLDHRARLFELFTVYESFVAKNRQTIQTIVRWVLESPKLRASLRQPLLSLHEAFARDVLESVSALVDDADEAAALAAGLVSLLDGNLVLSLLDTDARSQALRGSGLRALARLAINVQRGR